MAAYDDLPIKRIVTVGLLSVAITIITVLGVQGLYYGMQNQVDEKKLAGSSYREGLDQLADQAKRISQMGVDETNGHITIPVEQAIKQAVSAAAKPVTDDHKRNTNDEA